METMFVGNGSRRSRRIMSRRGDRRSDRSSSNYHEGSVDDQQACDDDSLTTLGLNSRIQEPHRTGTIPSLSMMSAGPRQRGIPTDCSLSRVPIASTGLRLDSDLKKLNTSELNGSKTTQISSRYLSGGTKELQTLLKNEVEHEDELSVVLLGDDEEENSDDSCEFGFQNDSEKMNRKTTDPMQPLLNEHAPSEKAPRTPPRSIECRRETPQPSPATQTLHNLSQGMEDLINAKNLLGMSQTIHMKAKIQDKRQEDCQKEGKNTLRSIDTAGHSPANKMCQSNLASKTEVQMPNLANLRPTQKLDSTQTSPANIQTNDSSRLCWGEYKEKWEIIPIRIECLTDTLGIKISQEKFPRSSPKGSTNLEPRRTDCRIQKVFSGTLAQKHGFQVGDWICLPKISNVTGNETTQPDCGDPILASFKYVKERARMRGQAFSVRVLRERKNAVPPGKPLGSASDSSSSPSISRTSTFNSKSSGNPSVLSSTSEDCVPAKDGRQSDANVKASLVVTNQSDCKANVDGVQKAPVQSSKSSSINPRGPLTRLSARKRKLPNEKCEERDRSSENMSRNQAPESPNVRRQSFSGDQNVPKKKKNSDGSAEFTPNDKHEKAGNQFQCKTINIACKGKENVQPSEGGSSVSDSILGDPAPFCKRCNPASTSKPGKKRKHAETKLLHHPWCPRNPEFEDSGAYGILRRIREGKALGCLVCTTQYSRGMKAPGRHKRSCQKNFRLIQKEMRALCVPEKEEERLGERREEKAKKLASLVTIDATKEPPFFDKAQSNKSQKQKPEMLGSLIGKPEGNDHSAKRPRPANRSADAGDCGSVSSESAISNISEDAGSVFVPSTRRRQIQAISGVLPTKPADECSPDSKKGDDQESSNGIAIELRAPAVVSPLPRLNEKIFPCLRNSQEPRSHETLTVAWAPLPINPWGSSSHTMNDILLFGPIQGLGHVETSLPSKRYVMDPFVTRSRYRLTHQAPEKGLLILQLTRDALAMRPWGFKVTMDEFDGACLVDSVDQHSPAQAATLVGVGNAETYALRPNDMVILANGKVVGGMTVESLEMEIQTAGSSMVLVVSRYNDPVMIAEKNALHERQEISLLDKASSNRRILGWREIGNAKLSDDENKDYERDRSPSFPCFYRTSVCPELSQDNMNYSTLPPVSLQSTEDSLPSEPVRESIKSKQKTLSPTVCSGISIPCRKTSDAIENDKSKSNSRPVPANNCASEPFDVPHLNKSDHPQDSGPTLRSCQESRRNSRADEESKDWKDDDNAWMGCICGETHQSEEGEIFWIQCERCQTWYDVAAKCVGFTMETAEEVHNWVCETCSSIGSQGEESEIPGDPHHLLADAGRVS